MKEDKVTLAVEQASTTLKEILNQAVLLGYTKAFTKNLVRVLIIDTENNLKELGASLFLIESTKKGLKETFLRQYVIIVSMLNNTYKKEPIGPIAETIARMKSNEPLKMERGGITLDKINLVTEKMQGNANIKEINEVLGVAQATPSNLRDYMIEYERGAQSRLYDYTDDVSKTLVSVSDRIADGSLSATMIQNRNGKEIIVHKSIRNMAEIETRYKNINEDLKKLDSKGIKFVVASSHADASERCQWWQGKIFLNDLGNIESRTMGEYPGHKPQQTILGHIDGKPYYSLKQACENGFLSFNCQHHLIAYYKGVAPRHYDFVKVKKERNLTMEQRNLESQIRKYKARTETSVKGAIVNRKNPNTGEFQEFTQRQYNQLMSKFYQDKYQAFCKNNNLPEYRWRTRITEVEREFKP